MLDSPTASPVVPRTRPEVRGHSATPGTGACIRGARLAQRRGPFGRVAHRHPVASAARGLRRQQREFTKTDHFRPLWTPVSSGTTGSFRSGITIHKGYIRIPESSPPAPSTRADPDAANSRSTDHPAAPGICSFNRNSFDRHSPRLPRERARTRRVPAIGPVPIRDPRSCRPAPRAASAPRPARARARLHRAITPRSEGRGSSSGSRRKVPASQPIAPSGKSPVEVSHRLHRPAPRQPGGLAVARGRTRWPCTPAWCGSRATPHRRSRGRGSGRAPCCAPEGPRSRPFGLSVRDRSRLVAQDRSGAAPPRRKLRGRRRLEF